MPLLRASSRHLGIFALLISLCLPRGLGAAEALTQERLLSWANGILGEAARDKRISGAAVGVVRSGETILLQGFGWQDAVNKVPLNPQTTKLRMCSLSKSFTAVSALQLIERGLLPGLDAPVNDHLVRYQLPKPWGDQVTLRHLMTHSSGMTGGGTPQGSHRDMAAPVSASEFARLLSENLLRAPGQISLYANLGVAVEGALIEDVSELSLAEYMKANIFSPLGMNDTLLHHTLALPENLATPAAVFPNGDVQPVVFYPKHPAAAASGGVIATPADMLRYAAFHAESLSDRYANVLSLQDRAMMREAHFRAHPFVDGVGLHLYPERYGQYSMARHSCGLPGFSSFMAVVPELELGFYLTLMASSPIPTLGDVVARMFGAGRLVATDDAPQGELLTSTTEVWESFAERFLPPRQMPVVPEPEAPLELRLSPFDLQGSYWVERRSFTSLAKLFNAGSVRRVTADDAGSIRIDGSRFRAVGDGVFVQVDDELKRVVFKRLADGHIYMTSSSAAWRQVGLLGNPTLWVLSLLTSLLVLLTGFVARWWRMPPDAARLAARTAPLTALGILLMLLPMLVGARDLGTMAYQYYQNDFLRMGVFVLLLNGVALLALLQAGSMIRWWGVVTSIRGIGGYLSLLHSTVLGLAALALVGSMVFFNLLGLQLY
ncbi:MAG: serine hydrolase domain-containing protein [Pseudomonadota bacterium]